MHMPRAPALDSPCACNCFVPLVRRVQLAARQESAAAAGTKPATRIPLMAGQRVAAGSVMQWTPPSIC